MSKIATSSETQEIITAEFDKLLKLTQSQDKIIKWNELKINEVCTIIDTRNVQIQNGEAMALTVLKKGVRGDVWAPERLRQKLLSSEIYTLPPLYVRPLGLKPCRNSKNKNHAYDKMVPSRIEDNLKKS